MYELKTVVENGEIHYEIIKKEYGRYIEIESFHFYEYADALKTLKQLNCN